MIPAALLFMLLPGCADLQPTGPGAISTHPRLTRGDVPFNKFFVAWSQNYASGPIQTQTFSLDIRQERQYANWWADESVLSFARAYPGKLYIVGDEPDQYCVAPSEYAGTYRDFVATVRSVDPTARFSPAGFAEPNDHCCPQDPEPPDLVCRATRHSIGYAEQFYNAYVQLYGVAPPVDEWRFHDFGIFVRFGDVDDWWARVDKEAAWSVAHGANMVLGAWGFNAWDEPVPVVQEQMKVAMGRLMNDKRINEADYWSYQPWDNSRWYLTTGDGTLTPQGQTFVSPLTDIPTGVQIVASGDGQAQLQWSNTTAAWAVEAEFWVQGAGSNSFVYHNTELLAAPGATQTPSIVFNGGDSVKGRVRYYNAYGQAGWSPFSNIVNIVAMAAPPPPAKPDQGKIPGKSRLFCFFQLC